MGGRAPSRRMSEELASGELFPHSRFVKALLTDMYQVSMAYAYWKNRTHEQHAVFELFFRKNPFKGEYTVFAGLEEALRYTCSFSFSEQDLCYLRSILPPTIEEGFFTYLATLDCKKVKMYAVPEGTVVFPRTPLIRVEGPLGVCQILETALLNCTNFASLIATNARRMRVAAGASKTLLEFGLRRAQGSDGAISASRYSYLGGFDGSSNCLAGKLFGMPIKGTHAHSFVTSFQGPEDLASTQLDGKEFWQAVVDKREALGFQSTNTSELVAFVSYAQAFPAGFLALIDTYDTLASGVKNFVLVALLLRQWGYEPLGVRLDSGDLSYLSKECRAVLKAHGLERCSIVASNDINEKVLLALADQGHEIDSFGIGTNLVTCQAQPALGMVYKLVEINGKPRIKLSNEFTKTTIPGKKQVFRLFGSNGCALADIMTRPGEPIPSENEPILCTAPFDERKRCYIQPSRVEELIQLVFDGALVNPLPSAETVRSRIDEQMKIIRQDILRSVNPTPYKVSVSEALLAFMTDLWKAEAPIPMIS